METVEMAGVIEAKLNDTLASELGDSFSLESARLYGVTVTTDTQTETTLLCQHSDVYMLLESDASAGLAGLFQFVALVTTGWAAPLPENQEMPDVPPSEHSERRRVRLTVLVNRDEMGSVIRFADTDETVADPGTASGMLADALREYADRVLA